MIEVENVSFAYPDGPPVLAGFSLGVAKGSFVSLIGRNGSGKSTVAKLLNGLLLPLQGRVTVDGLQTSRIARITDVRRRVQLVFQNPDNQLVGLTVEEDIAFGLENLGVAWPEMGERIDWALDFARLRPLRSRPVSELSGGEKQRVALAGVLALRPRCVILDEATSMLDDESREELLCLVHEMNRELGMTVVQITQNLEEAGESDRILVLDGGRIALEGTPASIFASTERLESLGLVAPGSGSGVNGWKADKWIADQSPSACPLSQSVFVRRTAGADLQIDLEDVSYYYNRGRSDEVRALVGARGRVRRREILAILGREGSGKSTLLQLLDGLLQPTGGRVLVDREPLTAQRAVGLRARVAMVFQYPEHQLFAPTVFDDIAFAARQRSLTEPEVTRRVYEAAALVGLDLDRLGSRRPLELSGGERRKVAIAGSLVVRPDLLLLDEPMCGLDPLARRDLAAVFRRLRAEWGTGVVLVSHSLKEALTTAERLMVLDRGMVDFDGSPCDLLRQQESLAGWGRRQETGVRGQGSGDRGQEISTGGWGTDHRPLTTEHRAPTTDPYPTTNHQPLTPAALRLGQLVPGNSLLHRLDPRTKFLVGLVLTTGFFVASTYPQLLALAMVAALLCGLSRLHVGSVIRSLRPILLTVIGASFLHLFASPGPYFAELGPVKLSQPGLAEAGMVDLRLVSFMVIAALLSWTTSSVAMAEGVERLLSPLSRLGVPVRDLAMMVSIALRFVPTLVSELERLMKAQTARGVDFRQGSLLRRARKLSPLVIPLIVATMQRGEDLAAAMESRCYDGRQRSRFYRLRLTGLDAGVLVGSAGVVAGLLWFLH